MKLCAYVKSNISAYIDGCLREDDRKKIKNHIDECEKCREEYEKILLISNALNSENIEVPDGYMQSLKAKIAHECVSRKQSIFTYVNYKTCSALFAAVLLAVSFKTPIYDNILKSQSERSAVTDAQNKSGDFSGGKQKTGSGNTSEDVKFSDMILDEAEAENKSVIKNETEIKNENNGNYNESFSGGKTLPDSSSKQQNTAGKGRTEGTFDNTADNYKPQKSAGESSAAENDFSEASHKESADDASFAAGVSDTEDNYPLSAGAAPRTGGLGASGGSQESSGEISVASALYLSDNFSNITAKKNEEVIKAVSEYNGVIDENTAHITLSSDEYKAFMEKISSSVISVDESVDAAGDVDVEIFFK